SRVIDSVAGARTPALDRRSDRRDLSPTGADTADWLLVSGDLLSILGDHLAVEGRQHRACAARGDSGIPRSIVEKRRLVICMKTKRQESRKTAPAGARNAGGARAGGSRSSAKAVRAAEQPRKKYWPYALALAGVLIAAFEVYGPSLNGPFLFDDNYLPFSVPNF